MEINRASEVSDLFDLIHESVIVCDTDGGILSWNAAAENLYGWNRRDAIGRTITILGGQTELDEIKASSGFIETGRWSGDLRRRTASGEAVVARAHLSLRRDLSGKPIDVVETSSRSVEIHRPRPTGTRRLDDLFHDMPVALWRLDLTIPMRMLAELTASGVKDLRAYLYGNPAYVLLLLQGGRILDFNRRAVEIFELVAGEDLPDGFESFWPESAYPQFVEAAMAALSGARGYTAETRQRTLQGREFDALFTVSFPVDMAERSIFVLNTLDISDLKQGQADLLEQGDFYRNLFKASAISVWLLDKGPAAEMLQKLRTDGITDLVVHAKQNPGFSEELQRLTRVIDVNETTLKLFGATDRNQIIGGGVDPFWIPGHDEAFIGGADAAFNGRPNFLCKTRMRSLDGTDIDVLFTTSTSAHLRASGHAFVIVIDMTDQVHAESALADMRSSLAHSARVSLLGELTATIAHEINQPLAAIRTNGEAGLRWLNKKNRI